MSGNTESSILELHQVSCGYSSYQPAICDISFSAQRGDILCLLGPSGCGKTTTLRAIAGFEKISDGEIYLNGKLVASPNRHIPAEERRVGMVFQEYALFPHLRVADNIAFGLQQWSKPARKNRTQTLLNLVGLTGLERRYPHELSGGQQQRVALARALAPQPVILLMDEPFSNLDPDMTVKMRSELCRLLRETHTTTILVTHDHDEAFAMANKVAVLHEGHLVQCDAPETLYHLPSCPFVAEFVGQADFIPGFVENGKISTEIGDFFNYHQYHGQPQVMVMIRPDDLQISQEGTGNGWIAHRQFRGSENLYTIRLPSGHHVHCVEASTHVYEVEKPVALRIIATHTVLFEQTDESDEQRRIIP